MRAGAVALMAVAALVGFSPTAQQQQPQQAQPTFRSSVQTVVVYATVRDGAGRLVTGLQQNEFTVLDNGAPVQIATFSNESQPITVALLLDMSASMLNSFLRVRESTLHFIDALLPEDRARIGSFGREIALSPILTSDKRILSRVAREELWPGGGTPMWNAIYAAMDSLVSESGRRVILVLTDGENSESLDGWKGNLGDVKRRAAREGFMLYVIGMDDEALQPDRVKRDMSELTSATGGGHFIVGRGDDLKATFTKVADELRRQYLIGFLPGAFDGKEHRLEVKVGRPGLTARARHSYVAARQ